MSTIFASDHALRGIAPNVGSWIKRDLKPRASVPAIGLDLRDADTMTFRRLSDFDLHAEPCYLPFCDLCSGPNLGPHPDTTHHHFGTDKEIGSVVRQLEGGEYNDGHVAVRLERYEDDVPGAPMTGETRLYLSVNDNEGIELSLDTAMRLSQVIAGQVHVGRAARHLRNTNEVDAAELKVATDRAAAEYAAHLAAEAETNAGQAAVDADRAAWDDKTLSPALVAHDFGIRFGSSRFGRRFPRLALAVGALRYGDEEYRTQFALGMFRAGHRNERAGDGR